MEEIILKERNQKFEEILQENIPNQLEQKLSLRKSKKNETLMSKRAKILNDKKISVYEPEIDENKLSEKVLKIYSEEKITNQKDMQIIISKYFNILENFNQKNDNDTYFILDRLLY